MLESFYSLSTGSPVAFLLMLMATFFLAFYFHRRAGSSYGFFNRVYALLMGGGEFYDEEIGRFWKERRDIERFNALFNVGAKSKKEIVAFNNWIEKFNIDVCLVANLRGRIDLERLRVAKVKRREPLFLMPMLLLATFVFVFLLSIAFSNSALLKFKGESQWLWLNHEKAYSTRFHNLVSGGEWVITKTECEQARDDYTDLLVDFGPSKKSVKIICDSFFDDKEFAEVDRLVKKQKAFFVPAAVASLFVLILYLELMAASRAIIARRHILHKYISYKNNR